MNTLLSTRLALAGTLALTTHTALAQTWQTVDDYQVVSNHVAQPAAITVDAQGTIYVAGMYQNGAVGFRNGLVRRSSDQGASWTTIEDFGYPDPTNHAFIFTAIGLDLAQNLYAVGLTDLGIGDATGRLIVRKSAMPERPGPLSWMSPPPTLTTGRPRLGAPRLRRTLPARFTSVCNPSPERSS